MPYSAPSRAKAVTISGAAAASVPHVTATSQAPEAQAVATESTGPDAASRMDSCAAAMFNK